ncbi:hypothetical protein EUX98_g7328 [Antrodiella citrinella]|uniref:Uncharacterized protein n=1 Tax=Antrodiella citrinella TaxID=2447956 RepID=A0A4V3XHV8_9APHY|nr:hypothetical protein EUX98_g7328 [Antrodiella citrinella]
MAIVQDSDDESDYAYPAQEVVDTRAELKYDDFVRQRNMRHMAEALRVSKREHWDLGTPLHTKEPQEPRDAMKPVATTNQESTQGGRATRSNVSNAPRPSYIPVSYDWDEEEEEEEEESYDEYEYKSDKEEWDEDDDVPTGGRLRAKPRKKRTAPAPKPEEIKRQKLNSGRKGRSERTSVSVKYVQKALTHKDWVDENGMFRLPVLLEELEKRPSRPNETTYEAVWQKALSLLSPEKTARTESGVWTDDQGNVLVVYVSEHHTKDGRLVEDRLAKPEQKDFQLNCQTYHSMHAHQIATGKEASRHAWDFENDHCNTRYGKDERKARRLLAEDREWNPPTYQECKGLSHLYLAWGATGHPNDPQMPSQDMVGKSTSPLIKKKQQADVIKYMFADGHIANYISQLVALWMPKDFKRLKKAFDRANWIQDILEEGENVGGGIFVGRVTLYKLQTHLHRDLGDTICAITCVGQFKGGEAIFPDLDLKLAYNAGDIILFHSQALWHMIAPWAPLPRPNNSKVIPGRISRVYTTHRDTLTRLLATNWKELFDLQYR